MPAKRQTSGQADLFGGGGSRRAGAVERQAAADLRTLRQLEIMPPGTAAIQATYKLLAREIDGAHQAHDRYAVINAARELLRVREALSPVAVTDEADSIEDLLGQLNVS